MSSWIRTNKQALSDRTIQEQNIDVTTFSDMQKRGYNIINEHSEQPYPKEPIIAYNYRWGQYRKKLPY